MKNRVLLLLILTTFIWANKQNVVTSIPDIADMVKRIGGDRVKVTSLATGREDLHAVPARPSFLPLLNRADLLITLGLDAEHSWLPALAEKARNQKIIEGAEGWISLNKGIPVLQVPEKLSRSEGEQHPDGNPHFNIGPHAGEVMAQNICDELSDSDPSGRLLYHENCDKFRLELKALTEELLDKGAVLRGKKVIAYHEDIAYLCDFYGMEQIAAIEPKPGVPPTVAHLRRVEMVGRDEGAALVIHNQAQSAKLPSKTARELAIPVVKIANTVGAQKEIKSWIELQRYNLDRLLEAFGE